MGARGDVTRRSFLRVGTIGPLGLTLANYFACRASGAMADGKARSVILLWLWGAPSQLDTFDMKPDWPIEYRGPFAPIATTVPGLQDLRAVAGPGPSRRQVLPGADDAPRSRRTTASPGRWA